MAPSIAAGETVAFFRNTLAPLARRFGTLTMWIVRNVDEIDVDNPLEAARGRPVF